MCIDTQSCPIKIYFLGELKGTDNRIKIDSDALLKDSLERIYSWKPMEIPIIPELLFEIGGSPFHSPDKLIVSPNKKGSSPTRSGRSGQGEMSAMVLKRDDNKCVFCETTDHLTDAHLVAYSEQSGINIESVFEICEIGGVQDPANGITLCKPCHDLFDQHFVAVNPNTSCLEVANALIHSSDERTRAKWGPLNGKLITARTTKGHWPTKEAFRMKYDVYLHGKSKRAQKREQKKVCCPDCGKPCKNDRGVKQHQRSGGCHAYKQKRSKNHDYVTPNKHMSTLSTHFERFGVSCEESKDEM